MSSDNGAEDPVLALAGVVVETEKVEYEKVLDEGEEMFEVVEDEG